MQFRLHSNAEAATPLVQAILNLHERVIMKKQPIRAQGYCEAQNTPARQGSQSLLQ
jgi:hypothetical protein